MLVTMCIGRERYCIHKVSTSAKCVYVCANSMIEALGQAQIEGAGHKSSFSGTIKLVSIQSSL